MTKTVKPDLRIYRDDDTHAIDLKSVLPFPTRWATDPKVFPPDLDPWAESTADLMQPNPKGVTMNLFDRLEEAMKNAKARGASEGDLLAAIKKLIHSPLVAMLVKATPNAVDDVVLETLKALFPLAA